MKMFKNLTIGWKLGIGFGLMLLVSVGIGVFSMMQASKINRELMEMTRDWMPGLRASADVRFHAGGVRRNQALYILSSSPAERADASFGTTAESLYVEGGLKLQAQGGTFTPYVGLRATHASQAGFGESGNGSEVALDIGHVSENAASTEAGLRFTSTPVLVLNRPAQFSFSLAWDHQLNGGTHTAQAAFASNPGEVWNVSGTATGRAPASRAIAR